MVAQMYTRKTNAYTELKIFPYASVEDLDQATFSKVRKMAHNQVQREHPWESMSDLELLKEQLAIFASQSAEKLRKQGDVCGEILIFLRTNYFRKNISQYADSLPIVLPMDTDSTIEIVKAVVDNLPRIFRKDVAYKKAGVVLSRIHTKSSLQTTMFEGYNVEKQTKIMQIMDGAKKKWGTNVLNVAAVGSQQVASNKNYLSREYTTRWDDILEIS